MEGDAHVFEDPRTLLVGKVIQAHRHAVHALAAINEYESLKAELVAENKIHPLPFALKAHLPPDLLDALHDGSLADAFAAPSTNHPAALANLSGNLPAAEAGPAAAAVRTAAREGLVLKKSTRSSTGYHGVTLHKGKYQAQIPDEEGRLKSKTFNTKEEAALERARAEKASGEGPAPRARGKRGREAAPSASGSIPPLVADGANADAPAGDMSAPPGASAGPRPGTPSSSLSNDAYDPTSPSPRDNASSSTPATSHPAPGPPSGSTDPYNPPSPSIYMR